MLLSVKLSIIPLAWSVKGPVVTNVEFTFLFSYHKEVVGAVLMLWKYQNCWYTETCFSSPTSDLSVTHTFNKRPRDVYLRWFKQPVRTSMRLWCHNYTAFSHTSTYSTTMLAELMWKHVQACKGWPIRAGSADGQLEITHRKTRWRWCFCKTALKLLLWKKHSAVVQTQAELMQKHGGRCLFVLVRAVQSEQTGLTSKNQRQCKPTVASSVSRLYFIGSGTEWEEITRHDNIHPCSATFSMH